MARILVVDDEAAIREFLVILLEDLGHRVCEAMNGREAAVLATSERPDLVIADIMMPVMGGPELCRWLKAELEPPPTVILTSSAGKHLARGTGADDFVAKPFDLDDIEHRLVAWLGEHPAK